MTADDISKLISRVALRDRTAFDALYAATASKLFGVCLRILKDRAEAEDALQDVYVKIWQKADLYAPSRLSPMSWLIAIARNQAIDRLRARRTGHEDLDAAAGLADDAPTPEDNAAATAERARIDLCLERLDDARADSVRRAYVEGYTYEQLATCHGVPLNTMRTWLRRSLIKLRECLDE